MTALRPEVVPLPYYKLNSQQRDAAKKIRDTLEAAVDDVRNYEAERSKSHRDADRTSRPDITRKSRIFFLSGSRGTGKTTVYASLRGWFAESDCYWPEKRPPEKACHSKDCQKAKQPDSSKDERQVKQPDTSELSIATLAKNLIWLDHIDLEPLPEPTNMLVAVLSRLESTVRKICKDEEERTSDRDRYSSCDEVFERARSHSKEFRNLHRLQLDAALGWDTALRERRQGLKAEDYASEIIRAEKARVELNQRFASVFEEMANKCKERPGAEGAEPLFVLPVDDFDLNPARCLDLLRMLRTLSVPRLFVFALGDLEVFEIVARKDFAKSLAGESRFSNFENHILKGAVDEYSTQAGALAISAVNKLLPPVQTSELKNMTVEEAFKVGEKNIEEMLKEISNPVRPSLIEVLETVWDVFVLPLVREKPDASPRYSGSGVFAATPRNVQNMWQFLYEKMTVGESVEFVEFLANELKVAIKTDTKLTPLFRRTALEAISYDSRDLSPWGLETDAFRIRKLTRGRYQLRSGSAVFRFLSHQHWVASVARQTDSEVGQGRIVGQYIEPHPSTRQEVSDRTRDTLIAYHDMLVMSESYALTGNSMTPSGVGGFDWASTIWPSQPGIEDIRLTWPGPSWDTFYQFEGFLARWRMELESIDIRSIDGNPTNTTLDKWALFVRSWVLAIADTLLGRSPDGAKSSDENPWENVVQRLIDLSEKVEATKGVIDKQGVFDDVKNWRVTLNHLFTPERMPISLFGVPTWLPPKRASAVKATFASQTSGSIQARQEKYKKVPRHAELEILLKKVIKIDPENQQQFRRARAFEIAQLSNAGYAVEEFVRGGHPFNAINKNCVPTDQEISRMQKALASSE